MENGCKLTPYFEHLVVRAGQEGSYEQASETLKLFVGVQISDSTIWRATQKKGQESGVILEENTAALELKPQERTSQGQGRIYGAADGSMIYIRKEGWKETKLGRLYREESIVQQGQNQRIKHSIYTGGLYESEEFIEKFEHVLKINKKEDESLILLGDGAPWINNYYQKYHPEDIRVLDFYHVTEKIKNYARDHMKPLLAKVWVNQMCHDLLAKGGEYIYHLINKLQPKTKRGKEAKSKLLGYINKNLSRMDYPYYNKQNYYIGSGMIESAHKFVIQQRLKKSGQRWSRKGASAVINLRILKFNNAWNLLYPDLKLAV